MRRRLGRRGLIIVVAATLLTSACGAAGSSAKEEGKTPTVVFSALQDPAPIPVLVMKKQGIDKKYGFHAKLLKVEAEASTQTFLVGKSDIAVDQNAVSAAIARNQGHDVVSFYPALNNTAAIVVPKDSPYQTPKDLAGKKVGHFGDDSGTTQSIALALRVFYHVNPLKSYHLVKTGPAALPQLLASNQVSAIFDFEPFPLRAIQITPGRYLLKVTDVWQKKWDWSPPIAMLTAKGEWLQQNPRLARKVVKAWKEATQKVIDSDYSIFKKQPYRSFLNLKGEKELDALIDYCKKLPCYSNEWSKEDLQKQQRYLKLMVKSKSILKKMPGQPSVVRLNDYLEQHSG
ncbi:MAG: ABC transporter substrate-binding protein [Nocardioidaceae bacterium]